MEFKLNTFNKIYKETGQVFYGVGYGGTNQTDTAR